MTATEAYLQDYVDHDGHRLGIHHYPDPAPDAPVAVIWPAMGTPARFYRRFARTLTEAGVAVIATDLRGTGSSTPAPSRADTYGYADLAGDVDAVLDALRPHLQGRRYFLLGHSLGGQLCMIHLARHAREPGGPAGLILVAVGLPYYRAYPARRYGTLAVTQGIGAVSALLGVWPGWGFGGRQARGVMTDWAYTARHGTFPALHGAPVELGAISTPVLGISVAHDAFTPAPVVDYTCSLLTGASVTRAHVEADGIDHFGWARSPDDVARHVVAFINPTPPSA